MRNFLFFHSLASTSEIKQSRCVAKHLRVPEKKPKTFARTQAHVYASASQLFQFPDENRDIGHPPPPKFDTASLETHTFF